MQNLKNQNTWVCWKYEIVDSRRTKVLYSINGHRTGTSKKHCTNWTTYQKAFETFSKYGYDGVGLILPAGVVAIDVDETPVETDSSLDIRSMMDTYEEYSPSGKGFHLLFRVDLSRIPQSNGKLSSEYYCKNPKNHMEIYFGGLTNRYMTFTGNILSNKQISNRTDQALIFINKYMLRSNFKESSVLDEGEEDFDIIATARKAKNGEKFSSLFDNTIMDEKSHSEHDQALCNILAFYTGGNAADIDRLFRQSMLYREKWEREDYRALTIEKAIEGCHGQFYNAYRNKPSYIYYDAKAKRLRVNCPMLAKHIRENLSYIFIRDSAKGGVLRYIYEDGCYRLYADEMLKGVIKNYITAFDESVLRMSDVNEVFQQITTDLVFKTNNELNADENIINFQNGILSVSDMKMLSHSADILSTTQIPCDWKEEPTVTPMFDLFMHKLTSGNKELEQLLLEFMGVCISNVKGWRMKKALFMVGPGDTGKSQLKNLTELLLGRGNYIGIDLKEIEARFGTSSIYNKRLSGSSDMSFLTVDDLKTFKKCTGGDSLFAEFKGQNSFEFTYNGLLWFCMNRLPKFGGDDGAWVYNRIIQIECKNIIPLQQQDKHLLDKLYAERDGIVYKAVIALKQVIANGYIFSEPQSVSDARIEYMAENNTVISFFREGIEERPNRKIRDNCTTGKVFEVYKAWCTDNNHGYAKTAKEFRTELASHLGKTFAEMTTRRGNGGTFYHSYTLTQEAKETYWRAYGYDDTTLLASNQ